MARFLAACLLATLATLLAWSSAGAQDPFPPIEAPFRPAVVVSPRQVVEARRPPSRNVMIVMDVSGSMSEDKRQGGSPGERRLEQAIGAVDMIVGHGTDDAAISAYAFSDHHYRWAWRPEEPCSGCALPPDWACMPNPEALESMRAWAAGFGGDGGTQPAGVLSAALSEPVMDMTIFFVTDGEFQPEPVIAALAAGQARRVAAGYGEATVIAFGIGTGAETRAHMKTIGSTWQGGFWVNDASGVSGPW